MTVNEWSPHILAAAEAMYKRLRIVNKEKYPKWKHLDIDAADHYCIAAELAITSFHLSATRPIEVEY